MPGILKETHKHKIQAITAVNNEPSATCVRRDESHKDEFGAKEADKLELIKHKLSVSGPEAGKILSPGEGPMGGRVIKKSKAMSITNYCLRFVTSKREQGGHQGGC